MQHAPRRELSSRRSGDDQYGGWWIARAVHATPSDEPGPHDWPAIAGALRVLEFIADSYFGLSFGSLSLVSFISDDGERQELERALEQLRRGDLAEALIVCGGAWQKMQERHAMYFQHGYLVAFPSMDAEARKYIDHQVAHLRTYIRDLEGLVFASLYGVAPMDLLFLRHLLPVRRGTEVEFPDGFKDWATESATERCIDLLAQYSIGMSDRHAAIDRLLPGFNPLS
jgi:hypothetical protein